MALLRAAGGIGCLLRTASFVGARRFSPTSLVVCAPAALRRLATVPSKQENVDELIRVLDEEIKCAFDDIKPVAETPKDFPFKIYDQTQSQIITLTREYEDEHIEVQVRIPEIINDVEEAEYEDEEDNADENDDEKNEDDDDDEVPQQPKSSIAMVVTVSKDKGTNLTFCCTAYPDEIIVNDVTARTPDADDNEMYYEGPEFEDLDPLLRKGFLKYLERRGITAATGNFLHEYMVHKDEREYHLWLTKVKDFLKS